MAQGHSAVSVQILQELDEEPTYRLTDVAAFAANG
jgi:hypothetical protein